MRIKTVHDLSVTMRHGMPTWIGNPEIKIEHSPGVEKEGFLVDTYSSQTHAGTHIDAPAHFVAKATTIDDVELDRLVGPAYCIRPKLSGTDITYSSLSEVWREEYDNKIILINTGWDKKRDFTKEFQEDFPGLSYDAIEFFKEHPVKVIGLDTLGIEPYGHKDFKVHKELLSLDIPFVEDMTGLDGLEAGREYIVAALPLKIEKGSGAMARVVAIEFEGA